MSDTTDSVMSNIESQPAEATLQEAEGRWVLTMTRVFPHPVERLWQMLTEPELLQRWSPVVPDRPLTHPGAATSRETPEAPVVDAEVLIADAPRELVHRWGSHLLRWTLSQSPEGCRLTLAHTFEEPEQRGSYAAGWHICLGVLRAVVDGQPTERVVGERSLQYGWSGLKERYDGRLKV